MTPIDATNRLSVITDEIAQDFAHALDVAQHFGIKLVEVRKVWGKNIAFLSDEELGNLKDLLAPRGMAVSVISGPFAKCVLPASRFAKNQGTSLARNPAYNLELFDRLVAIASALGTNAIRIFNFLRLGIPSIEVGWAQMKEVLHPFVEKAEKLGKTLLLENDIGFFADTIPRTRQFFEECPSPALKLNLDPGNFFSVKQPTTPDAFAWFYEHNLVAHMHVKNARRRLPLLGGWWGPVGVGKIDYNALFRQALDAGYTGLFSLETHALRGKEKTSVQSLEYLTSILKEL